MTNIPIQQTALTGDVLTATPATAGPDTIHPGSGRVILLVENNNAAAVTVTTVIPGSTEFGQPQPDVPSVSIPAGGMGTVGPFKPTMADPADNLVDVTVAPFATVNLYAIQV